MADIATEMVMKKLRVLGLCKPWAWAPPLCRAAPTVGEGAVTELLAQRWEWLSQAHLSQSL